VIVGSLNSKLNTTDTKPSTNSEDSATINELNTTLISVCWNFLFDMVVIIYWLHLYYLYCIVFGLCKVGSLFMCEICHTVIPLCVNVS